MSRVIIIGNGIAGITAARHIRKKSKMEILIISGETEYFFSRTALMYIYMGHMKFEHTKPYEDWFWNKNNIQLKKAWVQSIDFKNKKVLVGEDKIPYDQLILATGSNPNKFGWPGENLKGVQGLYSYQDLELMEFSTKNIQSAVVVGGGLIGIEMAEMLHSRGIHVTYLVRENNFWDIVLTKNEAQIIDVHIRENKIDLRLSTELESIHGDSSGNVEYIKTKSGERVDCQFVGLTVGVSPNIGFLKNSELELNNGVLVNEYLETNIQDVYAIGDCAEQKKPRVGRRPVEAVWYTGRMMGETVAETITGNKTLYNPGIWFNSAKFFDIEYQTYGKVSPKPCDNERHFFWHNAEKKKSLTISYDPDNQTVLGVNALGIRMRHEVWDQWIKEKTPITKVIQELHKANFDPELFHKYEDEIRQEYQIQFPDETIKIRKKNLLEKLFQ